jgi:hypothetical protein
VLSWEPRAYVYVDTTYHLEEDQGLSQLADLRLEWLRQSARQVLSTRRQRTRLGGLEGLRLVSRHTCPSVPGVHVRDTTLALSDAVVHAVELLTTERRYAGDAAVLEALLSTWRLSR